jgi:hypothetical protein
MGTRHETRGNLPGAGGVFGGGAGGGGGGDPPKRQGASKPGGEHQAENTSVAERLRASMEAKGFIMFPVSLLRYSGVSSAADIDTGAAKC